MTTPLPSDSTVVAGKVKENARTKTSGRSGKEKESGKSKASVKTKVAAEVVKKPFKVIVRKLPVRDFNVDDFGESIKRVLLQLGYGTSLSGDESAKDVDKELIRIEHFIEGKLRYEPLKRVFMLNAEGSLNFDFDYETQLYSLSGQFNFTLVPHEIRYLSRKRGPVSGAGFLCIKDEEVLHKFLSHCPSQLPFLKGIP